MLGYCCLCGNRLIAFRSSVDWEGRKSHKKCYNRLQLLRSGYDIIPDRKIRNFPSREPLRRFPDDLKGIFKKELKFNKYDTYSGLKIA